MQRYTLAMCSFIVLKYIGLVPFAEENVSSAVWQWSVQFYAIFDIFCNYCFIAGKEERVQN